MKGRANYLCLHRLDQLTDGRRARPPVHDVFLPIIREWSARTETGDRAELEDLPEDLPFWNDDLGDRRDVPRHRMPALRRLLRHAHAPARRGVRRRHRQPSSALRRRVGAAERVRRGHPRVQPRDHRRSAPARRRRHAVFRLQRQHLPRRGARPRHRAARRGGRVEDRKAMDEIAKAVERLRDHARHFFTELAYAHRGDGRLRGEERVRATDARSGHTRRSRGSSERRARSRRIDAGAAPKTPATPGTRTGDGTRGDIAALARRAGELRDELRFLLRAGDADYVYFVEFRGRGTFLRASPIDVSKIVREFLLDRMRTTVLTSATLTVDGRFDYIRDRLGIGDGHRSPSAVRVRFRAPGDPVSAAAHARSALAGVRHGGRPRGRRDPAGARAGAPSCCSPATRRCARSRRSRKWRSTIRSSCRARRRARSS